MTVSGDFDLVKHKKNLGVKTFTLAFAVSEKGTCNPTWGGALPIDSPEIINKVKAYKDVGGEVIVSTGGALGKYLENSCKSVDDLMNAYKKALKATGSHHLDLDVEQKIPFEKMNQALAKLQKEDSLLEVSYTLPAGLHGLNKEGVDVLKSAVKNGVKVSIVNPMAMNFPCSVSFGNGVIKVGEAVLKNMKTIWTKKTDQELHAMLGVTTMLGVNDLKANVFKPEHAEQLVTWAKKKGVGFLSFWSFYRDTPCPGKTLSSLCSSIAQKKNEFTKIFVKF